MADTTAIAWLLFVAAYMLVRFDMAMACRLATEAVVRSMPRGRRTWPEFVRTLSQEVSPGIAEPARAADPYPGAIMMPAPPPTAIDAVGPGIPLQPNQPDAAAGGANNGVEQMDDRALLQFLQARLGNQQ